MVVASFSEMMSIGIVLPFLAVLITDNVRAIRPGLGLPTKYLDVVLGKTVKQDIKRGTGLSWSLLQ